MKYNFKLKYHHKQWVWFILNANNLSYWFKTILHDVFWKMFHHGPLKIKSFKINERCSLHINKSFQKFDQGKSIATDNLLAVFPSSYH